MATPTAAAPAFAAICRSCAVSPTTNASFGSNLSSPQIPNTISGEGLEDIPRAGGGEPIAAGGGLADGVVQTRPPFARGDGKPEALCFELVQTGQGIGKERHIAVVGIEVMRGISARDVGNGGFRRHFEQVADDFGQAVANQAADAFRFGRRKTAFGEAAAHGVDDGWVVSASVPSQSKMMSLGVVMAGCLR